MKYRIGFDARMARHTGIGTYINGLLGAFEGGVSSWRKDFCVFSTADRRDRYPSSAFGEFSSPIYSVQEQFAYPSRLKQCQLWHAPHYNIPLQKGRTRLVVTVHDVIHWVYRKEFFGRAKTLYTRWMVPRALSLADRVIAVSEHTKQDLIKYFEGDPEKITVIHEGIGERFLAASEQRPSEFPEKWGIREPYFLYVGMIKPHKNVLWLTECFRKLKKEKQISSRLVLVGKKDKKYPKGYGNLGKLQSDGDITILNVVTGEELISLYAQAKALIHPSLYEGFGLTLLEAMACGTPVIANRCASIPEIAGEAAHLIEPMSYRELSDAILKMEMSDAYRTVLIQKGLQWAARYRWDQAAQATLQVYEEVLSES